MEQEEKMNWDKLLKHLEGLQQDGKEEDELNEEELEMLLLAEETNMSLNRTDPEIRFPVEAGWEELQARYREKTREKVFTLRSRRNWLAAAAALFLGLIGIGWWLSRTAEVQAPGQTAAFTSVKLTFDNGKTVSLDPGKAPVVKPDGAAFNGTTLVYQKESAMPEEKETQLGPNVLEVPNGKQTKVQLSEGTVVWVNSGSKITYPTRFAADKRELTLEGEAFFEVSHNARRPFIVHVKGKGLDVRVLGTAFNINSFGSVVRTALINGKVNMEAGNRSVTLAPGELGSYGGQNGVLEKTEADLKTYTAWKDGEIYFSNNTLGEIASRLEREYDLHFDFEDESLKNLHFTIDMSKDEGDIQKLLNNIRLSTNQVNFLIKGNRIVVQHR